MHFEKLLPLVLAFGLASLTGCQLMVSPFLAAKQKSKSTNPSSSKPQPKAFASDEFDAYQAEVSRRFAQDDFSWIDNEARRLRDKKERLPGGYFKLRALYRALEGPQRRDEASSGEWEDHIARLERWVKQDSRSITARVGLARTWETYAWVARGRGFANTVSDAGMKAFVERLAAAAEVLREASSLEERCPEWYLTALWVGIGQGWERAAFDRMFTAAVELDPTYYYLYQAKATYLLPRWYGEEGETERFAEESALKVGGHEGDIIFFAIYSQLLSLNPLTFMTSHQQAVPRILDGFQSIEKLYGSAPHRLNEACLFASFAVNKQPAAELFTRIGDDYDPEVWHAKETFDMFRNSVLRTAKADKDKQGAAPPSPHNK
jgi:hypothetical protein